MPKKVFSKYKNKVSYSAKIFIGLKIILNFSIENTLENFWNFLESTNRFIIVSYQY